MSAPLLDRFWHTLLPADRVPQGTFDGEGWIPGKPWTRRLCALFWRGKVFTGDRVVNRILGFRLIRGMVRLQDEDIVIDYPLWSLQDRVRPVTPWLYLGRMQLDSGMVYFTLSPA